MKSQQTERRFSKKGFEKRNRSSKSAKEAQSCLLRVVVRLKTIYISSREGLKGDQTAFRAFLKSVSAAGEGQQLLQRGRDLTA